MMVLLALWFPALWFSAGVQAEASAAEQAIRNKIETGIPGLKVISVVPSAVNGFYEVQTNNSEMIYASADGRHLLVGELFELGEKGVSNLTEKGQASRRATLLHAVPADKMISFVPKGPVKAVLSVFTDIDCPYCRKLHSEVPELNSYGIQVNYLAFPRSGPNTPSFDKYVSAWCAADRKDAFTKAKQGTDIPLKTCDNPVLEQYELGARVGVTGTPAIILDSGQILRGYLPAAELAKGLGLSKTVN